jgi:hypothetical protein
MRLEQRAGRVDRIGQTRTVHAFHLVGRRTGELRVLDRLKRRIASARAEIGAPDPLGLDDGIDERHIARCVVEGESEAPAAPVTSIPSGLAAIFTNEYRDRADIEAARVQRARALAASANGRSSPLDLAPPLIAKMRRHVRASMPGGALLIWLIARENASGAALESHLLPMIVRGVPRSTSRAEMKRTAMSLAEHVHPHADACCAEWRDASLCSLRSFTAKRLAREHTILADATIALRQEFQPGLFDRRADRAHDAQERAAGDVHRLLVDRLAHVEHWSEARQTPPRLVLALLP